ncbi:MAG: hypothetical protein ACE1S7_02995 [Candidatus Tisiphia sp.]
MLIFLFRWVNSYYNSCSKWVNNSLQFTTQQFSEEVRREHSLAVAEQQPNSVQKLSDNELREAYNSTTSSMKYILLGSVDQQGQAVIAEYKNRFPNEEGRKNIEVLELVTSLHGPATSVYRHEILAHISNPLRQRPAMYDFVFLAYLVAIPRHSLNF